MRLERKTEKRGREREVMKRGEGKERGERRKVQKVSEDKARVK